MAVPGRLRLAFNSGAWKPTREEWLLAATIVQPEEKTRIARFLFSNDARTAMAGRLLIRYAVHKVLGIPYHDIQLARTKEGKPYLVEPPGFKYPPGLEGFNFNVSHSGDFVVLAAEGTHLLGADVMVTKPPNSGTVPDFFRLMTKQYTTAEWADIRARPTEDHQLNMFYRYWCLKEGYIKAVGIGLGMDLQRLSFLSDPALDKAEVGEVVGAGATMMVDGRMRPDFSFEQCFVDEHHLVAVATGPFSEAMPAHQDLYRQRGMDVATAGTTPLDPADLPTRTFEILDFAALTAPATVAPVPDEDYWAKFAPKKDKPYKKIGFKKAA